MSTILEQGRKDVQDGVETTVLYNVPAERVPATYNNANTTLDVALADVESRLNTLENATPAVDDELTDNGTAPVEGGVIKQYVDNAVANAEVNVVDAGEVAVFDDYNHDSATDAASAARAKDLNDRLVVVEKKISHRGLRLLNWNVLGFNENGTTLSSKMTKKWSAKLAQVNADIVALCEYSTRGAGLFNGYVDSFDGGKSTNHNAVFSMFGLAALSGQSSQRINYGDIDGYKYPADQRYFTASKITVGQWEIVVITCHIATHGNYKQPQMSAVLNFAKNFDRVIVAGDFNPTDSQLYLYDMFKQDGYRMANYDLYGRINTYPATGRIDSNYDTSVGYPILVLDNIMVKGLEITDVCVIDDATLTDHCGIWADIVISDITE